MCPVLANLAAADPETVLACAGFGVYYYKQEEKVCCGCSYCYSCEAVSPSKCHFAKQIPSLAY